MFRKSLLALLALASIVSAAEEYLVVYEEKVRCYTCSIRYSVACAPDEPDCGIPWITRELIEVFSTEAEAIRFINRTNGQGGTTLASSPAPRNLPPGATFKKLYRSTPIALKVKTITTPEPPLPPPPPKVITIYEKP